MSKREPRISDKALFEYFRLGEELSPDKLNGFVGERVVDRFKENGGKILIFDFESYRK